MTGAADQYSLGCVLYECLTGRVPFEKDMDAAIIWAHVEEMPPLPSTLARTCRQLSMRCSPGSWPSSQPAATGTAASSSTRPAPPWAALLSRRSLPRLVEPGGWPAADRVPRQRGR